MALLRSQKRVNKRRKGRLAVVLPWLRRFGIGAAVAVFVLWLGAWMWLGGGFESAGKWTRQQTVKTTAAMGFKVENILVEGRHYTDPDILLGLLNTRKGDPLFAVNPLEAQDLIRQISWVQDVVVERRLPDTVYVHIAERTPMALWQTEGKLKLIDTDGQVIATGGMARFQGFVIVMGQNAPDHAGALMQALQSHSDIFPRVQAAKWVGDRRWDLIMTNSIEVRLPEGDVGPALDRLAQAQAESGLMDTELSAIDLREKDRIILRTKPGKVQDYMSGAEGSGATQAGLKTGNSI